MIKRENSPGEKIIVTYVCDNCVMEMPGAAVIIYYPFGHINDSLSGPSHFCSDKCIVTFEEKLIKKYGPWKSKKDSLATKVPGSDKWRKAKGLVSPKVQRITRKTKKKTDKKDK